MNMPTSSWRPAFRALRATPIVTAMAVLSLGLGIGANTALFSIFNSLALRTLPVAEPERLAFLTGGSWTYAIWQAIKQHEHTVFDGAFAWSAERFDLSQSGETEFVEGAYASGEMFGVLGLRPTRGRLLTPADDTVGGSTSSVVISHRFWQRRFSGRDDVVGQTLTLQRIPFTVVGVMPVSFSGPDVGRSADVMIPFAAEPLIRGRDTFLPGRSTWWLEVMVRLKPGQDINSANAALRGVQAQVRNASLPDWSADMLRTFLSEPLTLVPAGTGHSELRNRLETPLVAMIAAVAFVLLIACANITNLLVARALARQREFSVRLALGASRWQVAHLLLAESLLIAGTGAVLGLFFARWTSALLVNQFGTWRESVFLDLTLDWRVLGYTALLTVGTAVIAGVAPALGIKHVTPNDVLKNSGRGIVGGRRFGLRGALVVGQLALSLTLVVGAALFARTFSALSSAPLGFTPELLLVVGLNLQSGVVDADDRGAVLARVLTATAGTPGVTGSGISMITPLSGQGWNTGVGEQTGGVPDRSRMSWMNATSPGWFRAMNMPLIAGRDFTDSDRTGGPLVTVVNESFARRFFDGGSPIGRSVRLGGPKGRQDYQVVGFVKDAVYRSPRDGMVPTAYVPVAQIAESSATWALTVAAAPGQRPMLERTLATSLRQADPRISFTTRTYDEFIASTVMRERLLTLLSGFFGALALVLAGLGLYGLMSHAVNQRRTEIGVRMALGAAPAGILRLVIGRMGLLLTAGVVAGLGLSFWLAQFVRTLLFQLDPRDPVTFGASALILVVVGVVAAWLPARRASRLDPARVLRDG